MVSKKSVNRKTAEEALRFLDAHTLDPTPLNYSFAYLYLTGVSGSLRKAVDEMTDGGFRLGQKDVDELMGSTPESEALPSTSLDQHQTKLRRQAQSFADITAQALRETGAFNRDINASMDSLADGADLITVVRAMVERTAEIERKLAENCKETEKLRLDLEAARDDASRDGLTNLPNRKTFDAAVQSGFKEGSRTTFAFCDIDHFKSVNDRFGHAVGDRVLKAVASILSETLSPHLVARYGGEEFVAFFNDIDPQSAFDLIETAREAVGNKFFRVRETDDPLGQVTFSAGIATTMTNPQQALLEADQALYEAKGNGRNQTILKDIQRAAA